MKADFSICLIGRNEAKTLPRLEASMAHVETDRHFVDTGSTDDSCAVAESLGYKVSKRGEDFLEHVQGWECDRINKAFCVGDEEKIVDPSMSFFMFYQARNFAGSLGDKPFIFGPDCDETLSVLDVEAVNKLIQAGAPKFGFQYVYSHHPDGRPNIEFYADTRFWDRTKCKWYGFVHEELDGPPAVYAPPEILKCEHWQESGKEHREDYLAGLAVACWRYPSIDRNFCYFGRELLYRGRPQSAIRAYQKHLELSHWDMEMSSSLCGMGDAYEKLGNEPKATVCWQSAISLCGTWREPWMRLAWFFYKKKAPQQVAAYCEAALTIPHPKFYSCIPDNYTCIPHELAYWAYCHLGRPKDAKPHWEIAKSHKPQLEADAKFFEGV